MTDLPKTLNSYNNPAYLASIECGGTSFLLSTGVLIDNTEPPYIKDATINRNDVIELTPSKYIKIIKKKRIPTTTPKQTIESCCEWLISHRPRASGKVLSYGGVGIASFGPLGVSKNDDMYGHILPSTPKALWRGVDLLSPILKACTGDGAEPPPHVIDTDVNAPAIAEFMYGNNDNSKESSLCYVTIGTGVGVGLVVNSKPLHGRMHPEGGHVCVSPLPNDSFMGYSWGAKAPYHGKHTVEGIASSVALLERLNDNSKDKDASSEDRDLLINLSDDNEIWDHAANSIANLCVSVILLTSIHTIVIGGGVMKRKILYNKIRTRVIDIINGYLDLPKDMNSFIREPTWDDAGLVGAFVLAETAFTTSQATKPLKCMNIISEKNKDTFWKGVLIGVCVTLPLFFILNRKKH